MDADDYVSLNIFKELYRKAEQYHPDVVSGLSVRENRDGIIQIGAEPKTNGGQFVHIKTDEERKRFLQEGIGGGVWGKIYRKDFILDCGLSFPEDIVYEDNNWSALLRFSISSYYIVNEPFYHYVENEESII